jgi:hypothetical protein
VSEGRPEPTLEGLSKRIENLEKKPPDKSARWFSIFALLISLFSLFVLDVPERLNPPQVELVMPPEARLAQPVVKGGYLARVLLQPVFASTGRSQRVEVLKSLSLHVKQMGGKPKCEVFELDGMGSLTNNAKGSGLAFTYESGASPLAVTHDSPQGNVLVFELKAGEGEAYFVDEHVYKITLVADRTTKKWLFFSSGPLEGAIRVVSDKEDLDDRAELLKGQPIRNMFVNINANSATPERCT